MGTIGRNDNGNIADIRDYILTTEKDYLKELLLSEENLKRLHEYQNMPLATIIRVSKTIIETLETSIITDINGKTRPIDEGTNEVLRKQLVLLMASIDNIEMPNILELPHDNNLGL